MPFNSAEIIHLTGALDSIIVLDLTRFLSGPYATLLLASLGADVIKIDEPSSGDPTAYAPPFVNADMASFDSSSGRDFGAAYLKRARGKRSTTLNLKTEEGRTLLLRLAEQADVVIENFRPGVSARLGIDYAALAAVNPRIIHCALNGYGSSGAESQLKSFDLMAQAASGLMAMTGATDGPPAKVAAPFSDMLAGTFAALSIAAALQERERSGRGQAVEISMVDCLFSMMMDEPLDCYGELGLTMRQGNRIMRFSPFNTYRATDGWVALGVAAPRDWQNLSALMLRSELADDPQFSASAWRIANNDQVDAIVSNWTRTLSCAALIAQLTERDIACAPVRTPMEALEWPQLLERGMIEPLRDPHGNRTKGVAAATPFRFSRSKTTLDKPAPIPGGDTDEVLAELLQLDSSTIAALRSRGTI